ncbi:hypothetical protein MYA_0204 [Burkholderia sp. KJ006]|nr:hypothetical protein MYA_0204 [Burkholderia sp. KJ006]
MDGRAALAGFVRFYRSAYDLAGVVGWCSRRSECVGRARCRLPFPAWRACRRAPHLPFGQWSAGDRRE